MLRWTFSESKRVISGIQRNFRNRIDIYGGVNPIGNSEKTNKVLEEFDHISSKEERD